MTDLDKLLLSVLIAGGLLFWISMGCAGTQGNMKSHTPEAKMKTTRSKDGTRIAYWVSGTGPSLLLVHGTTADHTRWAPVLPALEGNFTVYSMDRRGRGESGDTAPYAIEREYEDIAAVAGSIPAPVHILAHSYGAICALEACLLTTSVSKLILYEPPVPVETNLYPTGTAERIQHLVDAGDRDGAVSTFFREIVRTPEHDLDKMRTLPVWQARVDAAHTIPREMRLDYTLDPARFLGFAVPTLLLLGGDSPSFFVQATEFVHQALPDSRIAVLPGQQHAAMNTAPELFLSEVMQFLIK
jgi:pimeloyl-ACP methyl ester carboxylesterase